MINYIQRLQCVEYVQSIQKSWEKPQKCYFYENMRQGAG